MLQSSPKRYDVVAHFDVLAQYIADSKGQAKLYSNFDCWSTDVYPFRPKSACDSCLYEGTRGTTYIEQTAGRGELPQEHDLAKGFCRRERELHHGFRRPRIFPVTLVAFPQCPPPCACPDDHNHSGPPQLAS